VTGLVAQQPPDRGDGVLVLAAEQRHRLGGQAGGAHGAGGREPARLLAGGG